MGIDFNLKIRCPVDVGDKVYTLFRGYPFKVLSIEFYYTLEGDEDVAFGEAHYSFKAKSLGPIGTICYWNDEDFNKTVFPTPEEAEEAETNWLNDDTHIIRGSGPL